MTDAPTERDDEGTWARLRRRKVVQWGIAYGAGAWGLMQGVAYLCDTFGWPHAVQQAATIVFLIGLPIVLVLAWYHGDRGEQRVTGIEFAILTALLLLGGGLFAWLGAAHRAPAAVKATEPVAGTAGAPAGLPSIAVLPFVNMSEDPSNTYFADGLAEELLNLLTRIPDLHVAARTSSFSFKDKEVDIATIARQLHVGHVLEGSVRKSGNRVRITAQLIKADDGYHVWSETYDRTLSDVFAVQDEIASAVVRALQPKLMGAGVPTTVRTDPEAYALYLQARQTIAISTAEARARGVAMLQQSLEKSPGYAPAWDQLARAYSTQAWNGEIPLHAGFARVRTAIEKAIAADPNYAPAQASMAALARAYEWNFAEASERLRVALAIAPTDPDVLGNAGSFLLAVGRTGQAVDIARWQLDRDPLNPAAHRASGFALHWSGRYAEAERAFRRVLEIQPGTTAIHRMLGDIQLLLHHDSAAAIKEYEQEPNEAMKLTGLTYAYPGVGRKAEALVASQRLAREFPDWAQNSAEGFAQRGEIDAAFEALERGLRQRDPGMNWLRVDPLLKPLRSDPRWERLLETVGLSDAQVAGLDVEVKLPR